MRRVLLVLALGFALTGCATNTGVLQTGPNAYDIAVEREAMLGGGSAARRIAYKDAAAYCAKSGRQIQMTGERRFQNA
jgi:hypothetical protein